MKTRFFMTMAVAMLVFAACSNDENEMDNWNGEIRLSSGLDVQKVTRAATGIQGENFDSGEEMDVFISENITAGQDASTVTTYTQPLVYTTGASGALNPPAGNQPYFPASGNNVNIFAYYPSGKVSSVDAGTTVEFKVEADQSGDEAYKKSDLMYGKPVKNPVERTSSITALTFTHLLSKVAVTLVSGAGSPSLDGAVVKFKNVMPATTLTTATGDITAASGTTTDITVLNATSSNLSGSAIIVPQTLPHTFIEVTLANGGVLTSDLGGANVQFAGTYEYTYDITVNLTSLDITSEITPWGTGAGGSGTAEMP